MIITSNQQINKKGVIPQHGQEHTGNNKNAQRDGPAQNDPSYHDRARRGRVPKLHGQRVRAPGVDRLPEGRQRLELPPL